MDPEVEHHVHESPLSMTGVLMVLALAVGGRRLRRGAALPRAAAAAAEDARSAASLRDAAPRPLGGDRPRRPRRRVADVRRRHRARAARLAERFSGLHRLLYNKYFVDEAYERLLGRPLTWISERVFLHIGDRVLLDGSLNGLARLAHRTAGAVLARADRQPAPLRALRARRASIVALAWSFRHG